MRCPSCGTQNEPDSRFCGGCGARLHGTLAPTHKIVPDPQVVAAQPGPSREQQAQAIARQVSAEYAAQQRPISQQRPSQPSTPPRSSTPIPEAPRPRSNSAPQEVPRARSNSVPQGAYVAPRSTPSGAGAIGSQPRSRVDEPFAVPKRRWGLILFVLFFDLGLAAAGVYLLNEGLAAGRAPDPPPPTNGSATKVGAAEPEPTPAPPAPPPIATAAPVDAAVAAVTAPVVDAAVAEVTPDAAVAATQGRKPPVVQQRKGPKPGPVDPYADDKPGSGSGPVLGPQPGGDDEDDDPIERRDERRR